MILAAPGPTPPPPPRKIDLEKLVPKAFKHEGFSLDAGQINDLVSGMVGLIENIAPELPELAENILAKADIATAVIAAVIGMPMLWSGVSEQSEINGYKQGYWEGMEDMARRYSDDALRKKPLLQWPPIAEPRPRSLWGSAGTTTERDWMEGKEKGCKLAFVVVSQFERARPGAGRVLLFALWYQYGENLGESIKRAIISKTGNVWPKIDF